MTLFLYSLTVIIWGTTFFAISLQNGPVDSVVSIFYRFATAGIVLFLVLLIFGKLQKIRPIDHLWCALQGACLFCFNFICIYYASQTMASGLISILFSCAIFFNTLNNRVFWGVKPAPTIYIGGILGVIGLVLLFWRELESTSASYELLLGIGLTLLGTYFFSLGNMISVRHKKNTINTLSSNAYGMNYGALILLAIILASGKPIIWDERHIYIFSLLYLAIPGSIIGFTAYLSLVSRIGANQAAYTTVLFPVVALTISSFYENYTWNLLNAIGLIVVLLGNAVALNVFKSRKKKDPLSTQT